MGNVHVNLETIKKQILLLHKQSQEIAYVRRAINRQCQQVGAQWKDAKFHDLERVVAESDAALSKLEKIFEQGSLDLDGVYEAVLAYEDTSLTGRSASSGSTGEVGNAHAAGGDGGYTRHLSKAEVDNLWKAAVTRIDTQIDDMREALLARGVPECAWLVSTLARQRAAMLEQEGYELDVASGHTADTVNNGNAFHDPGYYPTYYDQLASEFVNYCLTGTNPNYNGAPHWRNNCQRCVPVCEMRRRGSEVSAMPSTYGSSHLSWRDPQVINCPDTGRNTIEQTMSLWGDGARAQVVVLWDSPHGGGHTFLAEQVNGRTVFTDPQTGNTNVEQYFNRVQLGETQFCRIDNLDFSSFIEECYQEVLV